MPATIHIAKKIARTLETPIVKNDGTTKIATTGGRIDMLCSVTARRYDGKFGAAADRCVAENNAIEATCPKCKALAKEAR